MTNHADVVVVGSGLAGCTAAILLARAGLRVALLEAHRDPAHYKRLCTHAILPCAAPTLRRLGLERLLDEAGAIHPRERLWTRHGWVVKPEAQWKAQHGFCVRRQTMDPLLRCLAADTPGVEMTVGARVRELTTDAAGRVDGVVADLGGVHRTIHSRLVVGADGWASRVATRAGLSAAKSGNHRFGFFAYYRNVRLPAGVNTAIWIDEPKIAYLWRNDGDLTLLAAMLPGDELAAFREDPEGTLLGTFAGLTDGPDLSRATRGSAVLAAHDYPSITRARTTRPGVVLVGDAAMVFDPLWGAGCSWAFQSAEWLSDAAAGALRDGSDRDIDAAARRYQRRHRKAVRLHQWHAIDFSHRYGLRAVERLVMAGGVHDARVAAAFWDFHNRERSVLSLFAPNVLARAARAVAANQWSRRTPAADVADATVDDGALPAVAAVGRGKQV